jgi:hypothetical protein
VVVALRRGRSAGGRWRPGVGAVLGVVQMWSEEDRCGLVSRRLSAAAAAAQLR